MMTNNYLFALAIIVGSTLMTLIGLYVAWRTIRVFLLRLELLTIRNRLWDAADSLCCFDDPVYRSYRENLNAMIRHAHKIDLVLLALSQNVSTQSRPALSSCKNLQLRDALQKALNDTGRCMANYIFWQRPFTGIVLYWAVNFYCYLSARMRSLFVLKIQRLKKAEVKKTPASKIRTFGKSPDRNATDWFQRSGPIRVFGKAINV